MGEYLTISLKEEMGIEDTDKTTEQLNRLWCEFADEEEEKEYPMNFYEGKCGYTLNFITWADVIEDGKYFRDKQGFDIGEKEGCRRDLGFYPEMSDDEAGRQYQKVFPHAGWSKIGSCQIKLSGEHYCYHSLEKVKKFLQLPEVAELVIWDDEDGLLDEYISYKEKIISSRYCKRCKELSDANGIKLPLWHGGDNKNVMRTDEYNSMLTLVDSIEG